MRRKPIRFGVLATDRIECDDHPLGVGNRSALKPLLPQDPHLGVSSQHVFDRSLGDCVVVLVLNERRLERERRTSIPPSVTALTDGFFIANEAGERKLAEHHDLITDAVLGAAARLEDQSESIDGPTQ